MCLAVSTRSDAVDINDRGQIIGKLDRHFPPTPISYISQNDVLTILFPQADVQSAFYAINNRGQIVGNLDRFTGSGFADFIDFLLTPTTHFMSDLTWSLMVNG